MATVSYTTTWDVIPVIHNLQTSRLLLPALKYLIHSRCSSFDAVVSIERMCCESLISICTIGARERPLWRPPPLSNTTLIANAKECCVGKNRTCTSPVCPADHQFAKHSISRRQRKSGLVKLRRSARLRRQRPLWAVCPSRRLSGSVNSVTRPESPVTFPQRHRRYRRRSGVGRHCIRAKLRTALSGPGKEAANRQSRSLLCGSRRTLAPRFQRALR